MGKTILKVLKRYNVPASIRGCITEKCKELDTLEHDKTEFLCTIVKYKRQEYFGPLVLEALQGGASVYVKNCIGYTIVNLMEHCPGFPLDNMILFRSSLIAIRSAIKCPRLQGVKYSMAMNKIPKDIWLKVAEMIEFKDPHN
jgi:hypothetical protein